MAFNLSGIDEDLYFDYTLGINISIFSTLVLPPFLLCMLCVLALFLAKEVNAKIRVLLINIFAGEICNWLGYTSFYLGFPIRLAYSDYFTCKLYYSWLGVVALQKFTAGALYAIKVYCFIKYGKKKLKWYVIIPFIIISWVVSILLPGALPVYTDDLEIRNTNGFCRANPDSPLFLGILLLVLGLSVLFMTVQLICSVLTGIYVKENTLEGNTTTKKATVKVLAYLAVASVLSFFNNIAPAAIPPIQRTLGENVIKVIALNYILRLVFNIPTIATPIVAIVLLNPVRTAIKALCKCTLCKNNRVTAINDNQENEQNNPCPQPNLV